MALSDCLGATGDEFKGLKMESVPPALPNVIPELAQENLLMCDKQRLPARGASSPAATAERDAATTGQAAAQ